MSHPAPENADSTSAISAEPDDARAGQVGGPDAPVSLPPVASDPPVAGGFGMGAPLESDRYPGVANPVGTAPDVDTQASSSKADAAKEQGQQVKDEAVQGGKKVAGVAAEQGQAVAAEAAGQAKDVLGQAKSQLMEQAATQQENLTGWLRSLADELHQMVDRGSEHGDGDRSSSQSASRSGGTESAGVATKAVSQAHGRVKEAAEWLDKHEPGDLIDEATRFARRRPGAFLAVAAVGGLLVGRFTRGLKDDSSSSSASPSKSARPVGEPVAPSEVSPTGGYPAAGRLDEQESAVGEPAVLAPFGSVDPNEQGPR